MRGVILDKPILVNHANPCPVIAMLLDREPACQCRHCAFRRGEATNKAAIRDARAWEESRSPGMNKVWR